MSVSKRYDMSTFGERTYWAKTIKMLQSSFVLNGKHSDIYHYDDTSHSIIPTANIPHIHTHFEAENVAKMNLYSIELPNNHTRTCDHYEAVAAHETLACEPHGKVTGVI